MSPNSMMTLIPAAVERVGVGHQQRLFGGVLRESLLAASLFVEASGSRAGSVDLQLGHCSEESGVGFRRGHLGTHDAVDGRSIQELVVILHGQQEMGV